MRWTLGLLLLAAAGCGYRQTKMVACPETGCPPSVRASSPEGLRGPGARAAQPTAAEVGCQSAAAGDAAAGARAAAPTPPLYTPSP